MSIIIFIQRMRYGTSRALQPIARVTIDSVTYSIMEDEIEVLLEIGESHKEMVVGRDRLGYTIEQELGRLGKDGVLAYFSCDPGNGLSAKEVYILQRWDEKWGTHVDVSDTDQLETGDRLICTLQQSQSNASSSRGTVDFNTSKGKVNI